MTDEFDLRLRTRLERLAEAVPVLAARPGAVSIDIVRTRLAARSSVGTLAVAAAGLVVLVAAIIVGGPARSPASGAKSPPAVVATGRPPSASTPSTAAPSVRPTMPPAGVALPYPEGCATYDLSTRRCAYIVAWAKGGAGYGETDQVTVQLLGDPACPDGSTTCSVMRTMDFIVRVRLIGPDGVSSDAPVFCGLGGDRSLLCTDTPVIQRRSPMAGYTDVPCTGEAPENPCASPVPSPDASALAAARPLEVSRLDIPIDHVGTYTIPVGEASLPNGILSEATFDLSNDSPTNLLVSSDGVFLQIESLEGGLPFENIYAHGWHTGTERVSATLTFTVESFDPGAVLEVTNLTVQ